MEEKKGCIYLISCVPNGKTYIGQYAYENPKGRYTRHWAPNQKDTCILHRALWKYGKESFTLETLGVFPRSSLNNMEAYYAEQFCSYIWDTNEQAGIPGGYNMMMCGQMNRLGMKHTPEALAKMSLALTGRKHTPETCAKIGNAQRGKKCSPESIEKHRQAIIGKIPSDETRAKMSAAHKGRKWTDESKAKLSASKTGIPRSQETKDKLSKAHIGKKLSAETLALRKSTPPTEKQIAQRKRAVESMLTRVAEMRENGERRKPRVKKPPTEKQIAARLKAAEIMRERRMEKLQLKKNAQENQESIDTPTTD